MGIRHAFCLAAWLVASTQATAGPPHVDFASQFPVENTAGFFTASVDVSGSTAVYSAWSDVAMPAYPPGQLIIPPPPAEIFAYDLGARQTTQLTNAPGTQCLPAVSGDAVVWDDGRSLDGWYRVWGTHLVLGGEGPFCSYLENAVSFPDASQRYVAWQDLRTAGPDIYAYDRQTHEEFRVSDAPDNYSHAFVRLSGNLAVFASGCGPGINDNLELADLDQRTWRHLTTRDSNPGSERNPSICGDVVVWMDSRIPPNEDGMSIWGMRLSTGEQFPISAHAGACFPDVSERYVVWSYYQNGQYDVYGYDLLTGVEFQISNDPTGLELFPRLDGNTVVWVSEFLNSELQLTELDAYGNTIIPEPAALSLLVLGAPAVRRRRAVRNVP